MSESEEIKVMGSPESVITEQGFGGSVSGHDPTGNFAHLPKRERADAKARSAERKQKWQRGLESRQSMTSAHHDAENARINASLAAWEEKNAA
jgi:hypothetical protein